MISLINEELYEIIGLSVKSRLLVFLLQFVFNLLIPDHKSDGFLNGFESELRSPLDQIIYNLLIGLNRWDSQYFIAIARNGYTNEEFLAFFPLFPISLRFLAQILNTIQTIIFGQNVISFYCLLLISSFLINFVLFILTAIVLYKLTDHLFGNKEFSRNVVHWFAYNPSSIFFSSSYSETMYAFFTFTAIYLTHLSTNFYHLLMASIIFGLSSSTRSNGIISIGFVLYKQLNYILNECFVKNKSLLAKNWFQKLVYRLTETLIYIPICLTPFLFYQWFAYKEYCLNKSDIKEWCLKTIPLSYTYVQNKYWKVGFLRYYQIKQIPNFLLALPIIILVFKTSIDYLILNMKELVSNFSKFSMKSYKVSEKHRLFDYLAHNKSCFVHIIHVLSLTLSMVLFAHIQVTTRLLFSGSPLPYWAIASIQSKAKDIAMKTTKLWFYGYFIIGILLHSNFLPFT